MQLIFMITLHFFHKIISIKAKEHGYIVKYRNYYKSSEKREKIHLKRLKNASLCRAIRIVIRILNPNCNPDHPHNSMAFGLWSKFHANPVITL